MAELFLHIPPFAPDQSGVVSALYEMGGLLVVCDAGGCTGNICGFDEPRWAHKRCALFSASLRDMDAILGRDDLLIQKTLEACAAIEPAFLAIIGTPVPAVIGTDFLGLRRMAEKQLHIPVLTFPTTGTRAYDLGLSEAYQALVTTWTERREQRKETTGEKILGVFGANPLDCGMTEEELRSALTQEGWSRVILHGFGNGLRDIVYAGSVTENLVLAPSGYAAAKFLETTLGIPATIRYPKTTSLCRTIATAKETITQKNPRVLCIHQEVLAHTLAKELNNILPEAKITCATFFSTLPMQNSLRLTDEASFVHCVTTGDFDVLIADKTLAAALPRGVRDRLLWIDLPHFAVSGAR